MRFLVVVITPSQKQSPQVQQSYLLPNTPKVQWIDASSPSKAIERCDVKPGGKAYVVQGSHVETFTRAEMAPLISDRSSSLEAAA